MGRERGPELVNLPYGSAVYPADKSQQMVQPLTGGSASSGSGGSLTLTVPVSLDGREIARGDGDLYVAGVVANEPPTATGLQIVPPQTQGEQSTMTTRHDLPGGGWADIKDPTEVTNSERRLVRQYLMTAQSATSAKLASLGVTAEMSGNLPPELAAKVNAATTFEDLDLIDDAQAALIVAYTAGWSLERPLPTMGTVNDLPGPVYDALAQATTVIGDVALDTSVDGVRDPESPTMPSGG